jgi:hypothetical protein
VVFHQRAARSQLSKRYILSSSFAFLQSLAQRDLVRPPQQANTSHGLSFPSAHQDLAVHLPRALPQPATFRLQGLATLMAVYSRRARAGFVSHRRRSWDSPFGAFSSRKVPAAFADECTHLPFHPSVFPTPKRWAGPIGRGSWVLTLPRVPGSRMGVSSSVCWRLPWVSPSQGIPATVLSGLSPELLPRASQTWPQATAPVGASESQSTPAWPRPSRPASRANRTGQPSQGLCTSTIPHIRGGQHPGYLFRLMPRRALLPTGRQSLGFETSLYRSCPGFA